MSDKAELGEYLRVQRARLLPADVGLPGGVHRRTPGLRRQEVAQLAGISIDYYIKLEQGRGSHPSPQVLSALGRALMLSRDEREYLFRLSGDVAPLAEGPSNAVSSSVRFLLDNMPEVPAYVVDAAWNLLAWNDLAEYFIGDLIAMPEGDRNLARWMFRDADDDPFWREQASLDFASIVVGDLRSSFLRFPGFDEIRLLTAELNATSARFHRLWDEREPESRPTVLKRLHVPGRGDYFFECQMLGIADTGQQLITYCSEPGSVVREALRTYGGYESAGSLVERVEEPVAERVHTPERGADGRP